MALEAVVLQQDIFGFSMKELYSMVGEAWVQEAKGGAKEYCCSSVARSCDDWDARSSSPATTEGNCGTPVAACSTKAEAAVGRRKRRRSKKFKNKEEVESQRITHIAVERNRRKQMNEYLAMLRSLMPASYVQRGDQASIVGGAINFVKELEQLVLSLEAHKRIKPRFEESPFADWFTFPQYSSGRSTSENAEEAAAKIEVNVVDSHASVKIFSRWRQRQLLRLVASLQSLRLTTLHLNVTTVRGMVLYGFSLKVEDGCEFTSVDAIATAIHQIMEINGESESRFFSSSL